MAITLTLKGDGTRDSRTLAAGTLSIGRGERNDWVLPDAGRTLSKTHCVISVEGGRYILTDLSTNGMFLNGGNSPTTRDSRTVLTDGDTIRLGDYTITAAETGEGASLPTYSAARSGGILDVDPLSDPLGRPPDPAFSHPVHQPPAQHRLADPFDLPDQGRPAVPDQDRFAGVAPRQEWRGPSQPDHADAPKLAVQMPRTLAPMPHPSAIDFDALIGDLSDFAPKPVRTPLPPRPDPFADLGAAPAPFTEAAPTPPAPPAAPQLPQPPITPAAVPATPAAPTPLSSDALSAFLEGAGVPNAPTGPDALATLRAAGEVFRALTEGVRDVLMSRAALKGELRVEQTLLKSGNNNALKFSFSPDEAIIALLSTGRPGYMPPTEAAREALDDIKMHEIAVVSGMQTALYALLDRFNPGTIEGRVSRDALSSMLPAARKAKLWEAFRDLHATIKNEAAEDFQAVFGRSFAKAYKEQTKKD